MDLPASDGVTPFAAAAAGNHAPSVRLLGSGGADADRPDQRGRTALSVAVAKPAVPTALVATVAALADCGACLILPLGAGVHNYSQLRALRRRHHLPRPPPPQAFCSPIVALRCGIYIS